VEEEEAQLMEELRLVRGDAELLSAPTDVIARLHDRISRLERQFETKVNTSPQQPRFSTSSD
jgi:hypothetical protein